MIGFAVEKFSPEFMMKGLFYLACSCLIPILADAQDQIQTKDKQILEVRVIEEGKKETQYYNWNDPAKVVSKIPRKRVRKIHYEEPAQGTKVIVIQHDKLSGKGFFSDLTSYLLQSGYQLEKFDTDRLMVISGEKSGHRLSFQIDENNAYFSCYENTSADEEKSFSSGAENVIQLQSPDRPDDTLEGFPKYARMKSGTRAFSAMDEICRKYLLHDKASLSYRRE